MKYMHTICYLCLINFSCSGAEGVLLNRDPVGIHLSAIDKEKWKFLAIMTVEMDDGGKMVVKKSLPVVGGDVFNEADISKSLPVSVDQFETFYEKRKMDLIVYVDRKNNWVSNETRILRLEILQELLINKLNGEEIKSKESGPVERYLSREYFRTTLKARGWDIDIEKKILDQFVDVNTTDLEKVYLLDMFAKYVDSISNLDVIRTLLATSKQNDAVRMKTGYIMLLLAIVKDSKYSGKLDESFIKIIKDHCFWWNDKSFKEASFGERAIYFARSYILLNHMSQKYKEFYRQ